LALKLSFHFRDLLSKKILLQLKLKITKKLIELMENLWFQIEIWLHVLANIDPKSFFRETMANFNEKASWQLDLFQGVQILF
jgi:hypothetical protein